MAMHKANFQTGRKHRQSRWKTCGEPPDTIRDLSILPCRDDLHAEAKPFLRANRISGAYEDTPHYCDVMFRLMREDFVEPLRNALQSYRVKGSGRCSDSTILFYDNVKIVGLNVDMGIEHILLLDMSTLKQIQWDIEKDLQFGSLLCLSIDNFNKSILFAIVTQFNRDGLKKGVLRVKFQTCLSDVFMFSSEQRLTMTESPAFFEAYKHVLEGLQEIVDRPLPMAQHIVRCEENIEKPVYLSRSVARSYDLSCLLKDNSTTPSCFNVLVESAWPALSNLCLNENQKQAVFTALTNKLALIQGPPGTGKTYVGLKIMQTLLDNARNRTKTESINKSVQDPILVVGFTNHAVDQFLEGILQFCPEGVVRVGGQSDSQCLQQFNLRELRLKKKSPKSLRMKNIKIKMVAIGKKIKKLSRTLQAVQKAIQMKSVLKNVIPDPQYQSLSVDSSEPSKGDIPYWLNTVDLQQRSKDLGVADSLKKRRKSSRTPSSLGTETQELKKCVPMNAKKAGKIVNVWQLSRSARFQLYKYWVTSYLSLLSSDLKDLIDQYETVFSQRQELRKMQDVSILKSAKVIGMTTTGAAKYRSQLQAVGPRIVVVEEAAEVLEAHIITALSEQCQHLILIGDHQQLRPKTQVFSLATEFNLDTSLFERLINNKVRCVQLTEQLRMRPEISVYLNHIYSNLTDGASVKDRPHIKGMGTDVFFITHNHREDVVNNSKSRLNRDEAKYLTALCEYLIMQGYSKDDITILGTYSGQVALIKEFIAHQPLAKDVTVSTVDNFQGEQNKIILLSLVRSNRFGSVGFLSTNNRVCVALSRAQCGLYVIGDVNMLASHSALWDNVKKTACSRKCIGDVLQLKCRSHGRITKIKNHADFGQPVRGGCGRPCSQKMKCGHLCSLPCHPSNHSSIQCRLDCNKTCTRGHACRAKCFELCPPCNVRMIYKFEECGHIQRVQCHVQTSSLKCCQPCDVKCIRGHRCLAKCHEPCPPCVETFQLSFDCGHKVDLICGQSSINRRTLISGCQARCAKSCSRGHRCVGLCSSSCPPCGARVTCTHSCGHKNEVACAEVETANCTKLVCSVLKKLRGKTSRSIF